MPGALTYEEQLLNMQAENLARQNKSLTDFQPLMLESLGLRRNAAGTLERAPTTTTEDPFLSRFTLDQKQRLLGTYRSPQMEASLSAYKSNLPAAGTTVGNQASGLYDTNAAILREGINRGGLESGANLMSQREGLLSNLQARNTDQYGNMNASDLKMLGGIQNALGPYQALRQMQQQKDMQDAQNKATEKAGQYQMAGSVIGLIGTIIAIAAS